MAEEGVIGIRSVGDGIGTAYVKTLLASNVVPEQPEVTVQYLLSDQWPIETTQLLLQLPS